MYSLVALTRNFGHQAALLAGLRHARGDAVVSMDCDLQHPPGLIPELVAAWRAGAAIVETVRDDTASATWIKRLTSRLFYRVMNTLSMTPITAGAADFRLLDRRPLNDLLALQDQHLFLRGMVAWLGYARTSIHYVAAARVAGRSSYSMGRMISFAVDAITAFSAKPLRISFYFGLCVASLCCVYLTVIAYRFVQGEIVDGWTSLMLAVLFLGSTQLITLGVLGEYVGRIYDQSRGRPRYLALPEFGADGMGRREQCAGLPKCNAAIASCPGIHRRACRAGARTSAISSFLPSVPPPVMETGAPGLAEWQRATLPCVAGSKDTSRQEAVHQ